MEVLRWGARVGGIKMSSNADANLSSPSNTGRPSNGIIKTRFTKTTGWGGGGVIPDVLHGVTPDYYSFISSSQF